MSAWPQGEPGPGNDVTDVAGVRAGHYGRSGNGFLTGATVVLLPEGSVGAVDVRGGAPGTRETDLLGPDRLVGAPDAFVLAGGSAYGLDAATGVMVHLAAEGRGWRVGAAAHEVVPIVPAAVIFDLGRGGPGGSGGDFAARPDASFGAGAAVAAAAGVPLAEGSAGAGLGARCGRLAGVELRGGTGNASVRLPNGCTVAAVIVNNAAGSPVDPVTGSWYGAGELLPGELERAPLPLWPPPAARPGSDRPPRPGPAANTVIGAVVTDAALHRSEARRVAAVAHDGIARALRPSHTLFDGDTLFVAATGDVPLPEPGPARRRELELSVLAEAAARCVARALVRAVLAATPTPGCSCYAELVRTAPQPPPEPPLE